VKRITKFLLVCPGIQAIRYRGTADVTWVPTTEWHTRSHASSADWGNLRGAVNFATVLCGFSASPEPVTSCQGINRHDVIPDRASRGLIRLEEPGEEKPYS